MINLIFIVLAFLCGSIPFGLIYGLLRGVDVRKTGSGNIGATNVSRVFGFWGGFVPITILDMAKGFIPVALFKGSQNPGDILLIAAAFSAILGHVFSPWLGFKGGKGMATSGGVFLFLAPVPTLIALLIFIICYFTLGRVVAKGSLIAACTYPIVLWFTPGTSLPMLLVSLLLAVLIVYAHRNNIKEMLGKKDA